MKVLVVEDDEMERMLLSDLLRQFEKVEVIEAADGNAAWTKLQDGLYPALCCSDMHMPGMSGIEFLRQFKSSPGLAHIPFVFITAATERDTVARAIQCGAAGYILKPFNLAKARTSLEKLFRGIRERYSEDPWTTGTRLGAKAERLLGYFDALKREINDAAPSIHDHVAAGKAVLAREKLDSLKTGCLTLGMWHAAASIENLHALKPGQIDRILQDLQTMVDEQVQRARLAFGIHEPRRSDAAAATDNRAASASAAA